MTDFRDICCTDSINFLFALLCLFFFFFTRSYAQTKIILSIGFTSVLLYNSLIDVKVSHFSEKNTMKVSLNYRHNFCKTVGLFNPFKPIICLFEFWLEILLGGSQWWKWRKYILQFLIYSNFFINSNFNFIQYLCGALQCCLKALCKKNEESLSI